MSPQQYLANLKAVGVNVPVEVETALSDMEMDFARTRGALVESVASAEHYRNEVTRLTHELTDMTQRYEAQTRNYREGTVTMGALAVGTGFRMKDLQQMLVDGGLEPKVEDKPYNGTPLKTRHVVCIINAVKQGVPTR